MIRQFIILIEKALAAPKLHSAGWPSVDYPGYLILQSLSVVDSRLKLILVTGNKAISRNRVII